LTFNQILEDDIFDHVFKQPNFNETLVDPKYQQTGYESRYMIVNMGMLFFVFLYLMLLILLTAVCTPCESRSNYLKKKMDGTRKSIYWGSFLIYFVEGSLEIYIAIFLNLTVKKNDESGEEEGGSYFGTWDNRFDVFNNLMLITMTIATALILFFIIIFYTKNFDNWEDEKFEEKYGAVLEEVKKTKMSSLVFVVFFLLRRMIYVYSVYRTDQAPRLIIVNTIVSQVVLCYLIHFKPLQDPKMMRLELFNELTLLV
jgi:hypothetical protein